MEMAEIRIPKAVMYLPADVLFEHIPSQLMAEAIERGKYVHRKRTQKRRESERRLQELVRQWLQALDGQREDTAREVAMEIAQLEL